MRCCLHRPGAGSVTASAGLRFQYPEAIQGRQRMRISGIERALYPGPALFQPQFHLEIWDGLFQTLLQSNLRFPLQDRACPADLRLTFLWIADAARVLDEGNASLVTRNAVDLLCELQDRHLNRIADVNWHDFAGMEQ